MPSLENPFTPESKKPKRSLTELFRGKLKQEGDIDKALREAQAMAESKVKERSDIPSERQRIEDLFDTELSDKAYKCIKSLVKIGFDDEKLLKAVKIEDEEIHDLNLSGLTSAEHLTLPDSIGGGLDLSGLSDDEKEKLRERYPQHADKIQ